MNLPSMPVEVLTSYAQTDGEVETRGVRGKVVKEAAKRLASAIRRGGDEVTRIIRYLDKGAAQYFKKYSGEIADELDRIAKIPT